MTVQTGVLLLMLPLAGVAAGYASDGRLANLARVSLRGLWLLWVAAAVQAAQFYLPAVRNFLESRAGVPMLGITFTVVVVWIAVNIRNTKSALRIAMIVTFLGASLNEPAHAGTRLAFIGDVIPLAPLKKVISPGDILIILGGAGTIAAAMRPNTQLCAEGQPGLRRQMDHS